jgi:hypothetical protein
MCVVNQHIFQVSEATIISANPRSNMKTLLRDLRWILPVSLGMGLLLSLPGPGTWWVSWLAFGLVIVLGLLALTVLWRSAGAPRTLILMLLLALLMRLITGLFFSYVLPIYGNDTIVNKAGYIFRDAYTYDTQSWELASSGDPLWKAFDRSHGLEEQYGGLTFSLSMAYRLLSPDMHRPWLTILLAALASAIGVALAWKGTRQVWGEHIAWVAGWIMALYPESLLAGASQIREPYMILFISAMFWGLTDWQSNHHRSAWGWMGGGLVGALLFSPGVAVTALFVLGVWAWLRGKVHLIRWWWFAGVAVVVLAGIVFMGFLVGGTLQAPTGPLANLVDWLRYSANYGAYFTELNSGWLQNIFGTMPEELHLPFIIAYGVLQPLLPAAFVDPAVWPMRLMGILRGFGWYALLPMLLYSLRSIWKSFELRERLAWFWLWGTVWFWIILCSFRAGGDQWDNPRYRLMLLLFQAILAAQCLISALKNRDPWLGRFLASEAVFLVGVTTWYISRYDAVPGTLPLGGTILFVVIVSLLILVGGWFIDRRRNRKSNIDI